MIVGGKDDRENILGKAKIDIGPQTQKTKHEIKNWENQKRTDGKQSDSEIEGTKGSETEERQIEK